MTSSNFIATHLTLTINFISILITLVIMLEFSCLHLGSLYPRILIKDFQLILLSSVGRKLIMSAKPPQHIDFLCSCCFIINTKLFQLRYWYLRYVYYKYVKYLPDYTILLLKVDDRFEDKADTCPFA